MPDTTQPTTPETTEPTCADCGKEPPAQMQRAAHPDATALLGSKCQAAIAKVWGSRPDKQSHAGLVEARIAMLKAQGYGYGIGRDGGISRGSKLQA